MARQFLPSAAVYVIPPRNRVAFRGIGLLNWFLNLIGEGIGNLDVVLHVGIEAPGHKERELLVRVVLPRPDRLPRIRRSKWEVHKVEPGITETGPVCAPDKMLLTVRLRDDEVVRYCRGGVGHGQVGPGPVRSCWSGCLRPIL